MRICDKKNWKLEDDWERLSNQEQEWWIAWYQRKLERRKAHYKQFETMLISKKDNKIHSPEALMQILLHQLDND